MAYALNRSLCSGRCPQLPNPIPILQRPFRISIASISTCPRATHLKHLTRASSEEIMEDSKFVPLNAEDPKFGPPALLLVGFKASEATSIQQFLKDLDGEFLEVIFCTEDMINRSLWDAMNTKQPNLESLKIAKLLPRICFLSGLTGEEMMMFIEAFEETRLEPAVFAALVPNSADKAVEELIEEIMGDHKMLGSTENNN
ncbi:uncharacterized protein LOC124928244 isoform X2 [Impatiens glandulifera]|uniref:uncharacterized protein LOC124928244 isoform X2 n=1 Tax=Impatiens glandulifera TaxID=253017 RepID=UPI001FB0B867|nr:uncharacterized protein LOC124928244 isoform X2 [Impatiens glandulifera]